MTNQDTQSPVTAAKDAVAKLFASERDLEAQRQETIARLDAMESNAGAALAGGGSVDAAAQQIELGNTAVRLLQAAIRVNRALRVDAVLAMYDADAASLRAAAEGKRTAAADILKKCEPALAKLSQLEGITFDHSIALAQRCG